MSGEKFKTRILLNIDVKRIQQMNCYDNNIIYNLSNYYGRDNKLSFLGGFDFTYRFIDEVDNLLDFNCLYTGGMFWTTIFLEKLLGISTESIEIEKLPNSTRKTFLIDKIQENSQKEKPVGIGIDSYECSWNPHYKSLHRRHYVLIVGMDYEKEVFYCLDNFLSEKIQKIPIKTIVEHTERLIRVTRIDRKKEFDMKEVVKILVKCLSKTGKSDNCNQIRNFAEDIQRVNVEKKVSYKELEKSNLIFRISDMSWSRYNFAQGLSSLYNIFGIEQINAAAEISLEASSDWSKVKALIVKGYLKNNMKMQLKTLSDILYRVADSEEQVMILLKECLN